MPSSTANTTARVGWSLVRVIFTVSPGLTSSLLVSVILAVRCVSAVANGTTPYDSGLIYTSSDAGSRTKCTLM